MAEDDDLGWTMPDDTMPSANVEEIHENETTLVDHQPYVTTNVRSLA